MTDQINTGCKTHVRHFPVLRFYSRRRTRGVAWAIRMQRVDKLVAVLTLVTSLTCPSRPLALLEPAIIITFNAVSH